MAAPMVSAAAAMLCSQFPDATLADVKDILLSSVQKLGSLTGLTATGGMLDLGAAMASGAAAQKGRTWTEPDLAAYTDSPPILSLLSSSGGAAVSDRSSPGSGRRLPLRRLCRRDIHGSEFPGRRRGDAPPLECVGSRHLAGAQWRTLYLYAVDLAGNETVRTVDLPQSP